MNRLKIITILFISLITLVGCKKKELDTIELRPDLKAAFDEYGVDGCILIYDKENAHYTGYGLDRIYTAYSPASTFKIFNSLVSLETGVIKDENDTLRWDGVQRARPAWNMDHNMRSAIKNSVVWFYQELARRVGQERMQRYINEVGYGNKNISGGIDRFWLDGGMRISCMQQVEFLRRLYANDLPFSQHTMDVVKEIIILDKTDKYTLRGKTGWSAESKPEVGWLVGYLETGGNVYFYATNITMQKPEDAAAREAITRKVFKTLGILP